MDLNVAWAACRTGLSVHTTRIQRGSCVPLGEGSVGGRGREERWTNASVSECKKRPMTGFRFLYAFVWSRRLDKQRRRIVQKSDLIPRGSRDIG